ncbi:MAG: AMP-binding protein [Bacteroidales bacterium]
MLANLVFYHIFGLTVNLWVAFYHGMTMVTYANPLDFQKISNIAREEQPTIMVGTPSFFWSYLNKSEPGDFKTLRLMVAGTDKCPDALRDGYMKKHGVTLLEGYGATETSPVISVNSHEQSSGQHRESNAWYPGGIESLDSREECKVKEVGKILVKGPSVMKGYYDPAQT